ncbi:MAG: hypothetical protein ACYS26_01575 [Planctomycetota bacterium]|jgi:hypothetical protein
MSARPFPTVRRGLGLCAWACAGLSPAAAQEIELFAQPARWRTTLEYVDADGADTTLWGVHFDVLDFWTPLPGGYVGVGGFGGVLGERGGLFAGGTTLGWRKPLGESLGFDVGLFVGAGGDSEGSASLGSAGDGLFLRPHLVFEWYGEALDWRMGVSHIDTAGGDLGSTQLTLGFTIRDEFLLADRAFQELETLDLENFFEEDFALGSQLIALWPSSRSETNANSELDEALLLGAVGVERGLDAGWFSALQVAGAIGGESGGFLAAFAGIGHRWDWIGETVDFVTRGWLGAAGGGGVDTGGGLVARADLGLEFQFSPAWSARVGAGYMGAVDGEFDGVLFETGISWRPGAWSLPPEFDRGRLDSEGLYEEDVRLDTWRFLVLHKSLSVGSDAIAGDFDDIQLLGLGAEKPLTESLDLSLRAFGAWGGDAGGYHEGQIGVRYGLRAPNLLEDAGELSVAYHLGAVGGGPVELDDGLSHQFSVGWRFEPRPGLWFLVEAATFDTSGPFDGETFGFGFAVDLARPTAPRGDGWDG